MFSRHAKTAILACITVLLLWAFARNMHLTGALQSHNVVIAMQHESPLTVSLTVATGTALKRLEFAHDGEETLLLSLPQDWRRDEVRGTALANVQSEQAGLGYVRWNLPAGSGVTFESANNWTRAVLKNPTGVPLVVKLTTVDLVNDISEYRVILMKDEEVIIP